MKLAERTFRNTYYLTSKFGWRTNPVTGKKAFHSGCDYGTNRLELPLYALENGIVLSVSKSITGYGKSIWVRYPRLGYSLFYAHLSKINVKKGQVIDKNTSLGNTGTTGQSTGIHLHLGVQPINSNTWLNPESIDYKEQPRYDLTKLLKKGSRGTAVKQLQIRLNELGFGLLKIDGGFGGKTESALINYQINNGLEDDGEVGKYTAHKLGWTYKGR